MLYISPYKNLMNFEMLTDYIREILKCLISFHLLEIVLIAGNIFWIKKLQYFNFKIYPKTTSFGKLIIAKLCSSYSTFNLFTCNNIYVVTNKLYGNRYGTRA